MKIKMQGYTGRGGIEVQGYDLTVQVRNHGLTPREWGNPGDHMNRWKVKLIYRERQKSFDFYTGAGLRIDEFDATAFFECLRLDYESATDICASAEEYAEEMGIDRQIAREIWRNLQMQKNKLYRLFSMQTRSILEELAPSE